MSILAASKSPLQHRSRTDPPFAALLAKVGKGPLLQLAGILLVAGLLRFYRINEVPPGLHFDEAFNIFDILRLLQGQFSFFFTANFGREPLYFYFAMVGGALFGDQPLTLRVTSAVIGTVSVLLLYSFARVLYRSARVAALAAFLLAISVWHIYYSHLGLRVVLAVPLILLSLFWFWRGTTRVSSAVHRSDARVSVRAFAFAGLFTGLSVYTYTSGRALPIVFGVLTIAAILSDRRHWLSYVRGLAITGIVAAVVFAPLGWYFYTHPSDFLEHGSNLSIWDPRVNGGDLNGTFRANLELVAGMFLFRGDKEAFRNVPFQPVFDPLIGALFLVGLAILLFELFAPRSDRTTRLRALLIATGLVVLIAPSVLSDAPPNFTRTLPALPLLVLLPANAISVVWDRLQSVTARRLAYAATGGVLLFSSLRAYDSYFVQFANSSALYYAFDVRMFDVAQWIKRNGTTNQIFMAPLWYQNGTLMLLTRNIPLKSFESRDTVILPRTSNGADALFAFPMEQSTKAAKLGERLGPLATREIIAGSTGEQLLVVYRVRSQDLAALVDSPAALVRGSSFIQPQSESVANWSDQIGLLGYTVSPEGPGGRNVTVTLFLRALAAIDKDYTFSLKVRDNQGRVWGQEDKWPGDNSYATTQWSPGDLIIEKFYPGLSACAPAGEYQVTVEAYNPKTMEILPVVHRAEISTPQGNLMSLGQFDAGPSEGNRIEDLDPEEATDIAIMPQLRLIGWTLEPKEMHPGDPFSLSLFWKSASPSISHRVQIASGTRVLGEREITVPGDGRGLCTLFDLQIPSDTPSGEYTLSVDQTKITSLTIVR